MPLLAMAVWLSTATAGPAAENTAAIEKRLGDTVHELASDGYEGRGIGTQGLEKAADFIAAQFQASGLDTAVFPDGPFQRFSVTMDAQLGPPAENRLVFVPPGADAAQNPLGLGTDFQTLAAGGSAQFDLPLAFVGYGITAPEAAYDDYAGIDVQGKCVVILRHQPQRGNHHSPFRADPSRHAFFSSKIANAVGRGAAAIVFCTGKHEIDQKTAQLQQQWQKAVDQLVDEHQKLQALPPTADPAAGHRRRIGELAGEIAGLSQRKEVADDPLLGFHRAGLGSVDRQIPIFHCRRASLDPLFRAVLGKDLEGVEREMDEGGEPFSRILSGWRVRGSSSLQRQPVQVRNVVASWEGAGPRAEETIVIGAHYDHLGYGGTSSVEPESREVHNGADDNASGVAVLLEVARRIVALDRPLPRRIVFVAFTGEERGLLGSAHYTAHPPIPLAQTIAMLNLDMVGRLRDDKLIVHGIGTAREFDLLLKRINAQHDFRLVLQPSGYGPSDHTSFYEQKIPVLHFFTGAHSDYHRPSDDAEKVDLPGMRRIASLVADLAVALAEADQRPSYQATKRTRIATGSWPYFGSRPDYGYEKPGVRLAGVAVDSPAERAGIQPGDVILRFGSAKVTTVADFANALGRHKAGERVKVEVSRDGRQRILTVTLDPPRR